MLKGLFNDKTCVVATAFLLCPFMIHFLVSGLTSYLAANDPLKPGADVDIDQVMNGGEVMKRGRTLSALLLASPAV